MIFLHGRIRQTSCSGAWGAWSLGSGPLRKPGALVRVALVGWGSVPIWLEPFVLDLGGRPPLCIATLAFRHASYDLLLQRQPPVLYGKRMGQQCLWHAVLATASRRAIEGC